MKKFLITFFVALIVLSLSANIFAEERAIYIDPMHGGSDTGFIIEDNAEKELNLKLATTISEYLKSFALSRKDNETYVKQNAKILNVKEFDPDVILGIHHHGKYSAFIEYNQLGSTLAYQLAAYFHSEDIPYKLIPIKGVWLSGLSYPAIMLIVDPKISNKTDWKFISYLLEGLQ
ncbi:MAG: N-acetylmuramoyl-L-alanine amidase [Halanaerobiales bacterium]|nr:N-acetylmuramoyl-L-alanine amidase [Halanaerobiales bacterium]